MSLQETVLLRGWAGQSYLPVTNQAQRQHYRRVSGLLSSHSTAEDDSITVPAQPHRYQHHCKCDRETTGWFIKKKKADLAVS